MGLAHIDTFPGQLTTTLLGTVNIKKKLYVCGGFFVLFRVSFFIYSFFFFFANVRSKLGLAIAIALSELVAF